jgi:acetamidase/formamidase
MVIEGGKTMMELRAGNRFYAFSASNTPALTVQAGEELTIEAQDCFGNQIQSEGEL